MDAMALRGFGQPVMQVAIACRTHPGRHRRENQDNYLIGDLTDPAHVLHADRSGVGDSDTRLTVAERGALLIVADGMGGAAAGRLASGLACTFIMAELQEGWSADPNVTPRQFAFRLREAVENANSRIHRHAQHHPETTGMGSTATVAGLLDGFLYIAQVGDSRAYLVRGGTATQLTRDQSLVQQMIDAGAMSPESAEQSPHGNVILQALGVEPLVDVDLTYQAMRQGDFLLLCSDGLHRMVKPEEIADTVARAVSPETACQELVALANERGGPDNITVVAALLDGLPAPRDDDTVERAKFIFDTEAT